MTPAKVWQTSEVSYHFWRGRWVCKLCKDMSEGWWDCLFNKLVASLSVCHAISTDFKKFRIFFYHGGDGINSVNSYNEDNENENYNIDDNNDIHDDNFDVNEAVTTRML